MKNLTNILTSLVDTYLELEKTKMWLEASGQALDPKVEADRYRELAQRAQKVLIEEQLTRDFKW